MGLDKSTLNKRGRGRPPKEPTDLITIDQAVEAIKDELRRRFNNEEIVERCALAKGTIYNKISKREIHRWGTRKAALVSRAEILKLVG